MTAKIIQFPRPEPTARKPLVLDPVTMSALAPALFIGAWMKMLKEVKHDD